MIYLHCHSSHQDIVHNESRRHEGPDFLGRAHNKAPRRNFLSPNVEEGDREEPFAGLRDRGPATNPHYSPAGRTDHGLPAALTPVSGPYSSHLTRRVFVDVAKALSLTRSIRRRGTRNRARRVAAQPTDNLGVFCRTQATPIQWSARIQARRSRILRGLAQAGGSNGGDDAPPSAGPRGRSA